MANNLIKAGDRIEIKHLHQNNQKVYKSGLFDVLSDNRIEITIPTDDGKMVVFPIGEELQLYFFSGQGMYTCEAVVVERYKRGRFLLFLMEMTTKLKRFQRREYFRLDCLIDFAYYKISNEVAELETTEKILAELRKDTYLGEQRIARTKNLSGGGMQFLTSEPLELHTRVFSSIELSSLKIDRKFHLVTEIISCEPVETLENRWLVRGKFEFKNIKERDLIVSYVFEEDRRLRKKENGI